MALTCQTVSAQLVTENFGSGTNAFSIDFVTIGNPGNPADTTGSPNPAGSVAYTYQLGKYEVSRDMLLKANLAGSLGITLANMSSYPGGNGPNLPATGVTWYEAARFVNWLNTSTGNAAAYKFSGSTFQTWSSTDAGYDANNPFRNSLARYVIPTSAEWYKGAYGNPNGSWSNFPNGSDTAPISVSGGTNNNTAIYERDLMAGPADITNAGGLSAYETMGQGGNVLEWTESAFDGINNTWNEDREIRGGGWFHESTTVSASEQNRHAPQLDSVDIGFRVASIVPEPSTRLLVALGLCGLLLKRRFTGTP